jgi:hypothetical protein
MAENQQSNVLRPFADHLTFFGYEIQFDNLGVSAKHSLKPSFRLYSARDGTMILVPYEIGPAITNDTLGFTEFLNRLNAGTGLCKYYLAFGKFFVQGCYPGDYERQRFGGFFESVMNGIAAPQHLFPEEVAKYFGVPVTPKL